MKYLIHCIRLLSLFAFAVVAARAAEAPATTQAGKPFASLSPQELPYLNSADQQAYLAWQHALQSQASTSTYQEDSSGPNTMDLSSDFSM